MTIVKLTRRGLGEQPRAARRPPAPRCSGGALARGGAQARTQGVVAGDAQQGVGQRAGVADGATRSAASPSVSAKQGRSLTTAGVPWAAASSGGSPKPSR